jgi:hypothetical protein
VKGAAQAPVSAQTLSPKMRPKSKDTIRKKLKYGPFKLRGANVCALPLIEDFPRESEVLSDK